MNSEDQHSGSNRGVPSVSGRELIQEHTGFKEQYVDGI